MESDSNAEESWSFWLHFWRTFAITLFIVMMAYVVFG